MNKYFLPPTQDIVKTYHCNVNNPLHLTQLRYYDEFMVGEVTHISYGGKQNSC